MHLAFIGIVTIKITLILTMAFIAAWMLARRSAAARQLVWTAAIVAVLVLPALSVILPSWHIKRPGEPAAFESRPMTHAVSSRVWVPLTAPDSSTQPPSFPVVPTLWTIGAAAVLGRVLVGLGLTIWIARSAKPYKAPDFERLAHEADVYRTVAVLESSRASMPLTFGLFRPVILLPVEAAGWTAERRRLVLLHELVHIRRLDWLMQLVAQLACALYWFHPLIWLAALCLRQEREHTCDDCVLALGAKGSIYAEHLLDLARSLKPAARWSMEVAMAQPPALEKRLAALLDLQRDRRPVNRRTAAAVTVAALIAAALLAPGIAPAQNSRITLSGIVYDASKARVPDAVVTATNLETHGKEIAQTDQTGAYKFAGIAAGNYALEVKKPGFKAYQQTGVSLAPGVSREADVILDVGQIAETVNVVGKRPPLQPAAEAQTPQRIRVGGNVQATKLISRVQPVYPQDAEDRGVEGTVLLHAVIGIDGGLMSLAPVNTLVDPELTQAALDAVRQWRYQPTLLNGLPVEVVTIITVNFRLAP